MNEAEFILKLQERAREQEKVVKDMPFSRIFSTVSLWLGHHPYRLLVPLALLISIAFRAILGESYSHFILKLFSTI